MDRRILNNIAHGTMRYILTAAKIKLLFAALTETDNIKQCERSPQVELSSNGTQRSYSRNTRFSQAGMLS